MNRNDTISGESKALSAISYLGWMIFIPIIMRNKQDNYVKRHINCALTLMIINLIASVILIPILFGGVIAAILMIESYMVAAIAIIIILSFLMIVIALAMCILQWVCLIRAALGYEAKLWKIKVIKFISTDQ